MSFLQQHTYFLSHQPRKKIPRNLGMAQIAKIEAMAEISSPPAKVFDFFKNNLNNIVNIFPQVFKSAELIEGEEGRDGNVKKVEYVLGKAMSLKAKTEGINNGERSLRMTIIEGDVLQLYSSFCANITFNDGFVNWCLEFEKVNESAPNPDNYAKLAIQVTKVLDLYLLNH